MEQDQRGRASPPVDDRRELRPPTAPVHTADQPEHRDDDGHETHETRKHVASVSPQRDSLGKAGWRDRAIATYTVAATPKPTNQA